MTLCPKCGGTVWHPSLTRTALQPPYCTCPPLRVVTTDHTEAIQKAIADINAAISYAPLGVRDGASKAVNLITSDATHVGRLLSQEAQLKALRDYAYWATYALMGIAGEKRIVAPTYEAEARAFLDSHGRVANELFPHRKVS